MSTVDTRPNPPACGTPDALFREKLSGRGLKSRPGRRAPNRHPARCCVCGRTVPAGQGCIEKKSGTTGWDVFC